jgi:hypothetical protein
VSNEKDQELLISEDANPPHLTIALAPRVARAPCPGPGPRMRTARA